MPESKKNNKYKTNTNTKVTKTSKSNTKSTTPKRKYNTTKIQKGGDTDICKKDINELLTTNKKIYTYNNSGMADGNSLTSKANMLASDSNTRWGKNPGAPPDPNSCVIL